ncbi:3-dehydro-L-gulonate 2-dehydrogenase [Algoriphagus sp. CAU 1675]|uniref:3-dehydro-L-gulonate 2-dehydrogenase n=1 Tax=Algoriphagus sp. CAU 1675 TaxID=3032597 RepID=UPI0023DCC190|nr:3-dehydro-L-gulonate 2-dehydrogenase [Algoriphagus sp. CAU 1675]MDF2159081.1 3-dehydro-L-gulonate 2-dehydrogenase [Algoriphagus sp. CAU 1675]
MESLRIPYDKIHTLLGGILEDKGFTPERAMACARLFVNADRDGVYSHGINRFLLFLDYIARGIVKIDQSPIRLDGFGFFERWDGQRGPGNLNADFGMGRAIALAGIHGMGCVALQNTNHWMRGGNVGWQAADAGCISIAFTNTKPNMPAWGGAEPRLGNNPLIVGIPRKKGPVVLDMAMSQFAYGKLANYAKRGEQAPHFAGFDSEGKLSKSPTEIIQNELALPAGMWKGAGLSLVLDMLASILSGGDATHQVGSTGDETGLSQAFFAIDPVKLGLVNWMEEKADSILENLKASKTFDQQEIRYPGEQTLKTRKENMELGIPVDPSVWEQLKNQFNI